MTPVEQSLPENPPVVNLEPEKNPSLDTIVQSGTWNKKQKRLFHRASSWSLEAGSRGCQLLWVMLSTAPGGEKKKLRVHFKSLRRKVERLVGAPLDVFIVSTHEGLGVLHMIWAIKSEKAVWIPQAWLSAEWKKIHGAEVVWISRIKKNKSSIKRVSRYMACQYLADQDQLERMSWSWWRSKVAIGKAWEMFSHEVGRAMYDVYTWIGGNPIGKTVERWEKFRAWEKLLTEGWCILGRGHFFVSNRSIDVGYV
jgi:hypothetical protein